MPIEVRTTDEFDAWLGSLDRTAQARIAARLRKLAHNLWGDHKSVGGAVLELREHFGAGYRIYVSRRGQALVVVLAGGDKSSQSADIRRAIELARQL